MRLFQVTNKGGHPQWVFADTPEEARQIFFRNTPTRKLENVRVLKEAKPTDFDQTNRKSVNVKGIGAVRYKNASSEREWLVFDKEHFKE